MFRILFRGEKYFPFEDAMLKKIFDDESLKLRKMKNNPIL